MHAVEVCISVFMSAFYLKDPMCSSRATLEICPILTFLLASKLENLDHTLKNRTELAKT